MNSTWNNREDEPCPLGECRHVYDDWPRGSVTRRDREYDQCEFCGWTEAEVEAIKTRPPSKAAPSETPRCGLPVYGGGICKLPLGHIWHTQDGGCEK